LKKNIINANDFSEMWNYIPLQNDGKDYTLHGHPYSLVDEVQVSQGPQQEKQKYQMDGQLEGAEELGYGAHLVQLSMLLVAEAQRNPFTCARELGLLLAFLDRNMVILRLKEVDLRIEHDAMKDMITDKLKLYLLTFADINVDHQWKSYFLTNIDLAQHRTQF
jgi:hypothetical protein